MDNLQLLGVTTLIITLYGSRYLRDQAFSTLSDVEKINLIDSFKDIRKSRYLISAILIFLIFIFASINKSNGLGLIIVTSIFLAYVAIYQIIAFRKMKNLALPLSYFRAFWKAQVLNFCGFILFFAFVVLGPSIKIWWQADKCLDSGGRFNYQTKGCEY